MRVESLTDNVSALPTPFAADKALVGLLGQRVKLGNGVVKCLLGKVACAIGAVQNLVATSRSLVCAKERYQKGSLENGEVERKTQTNWVRWGKLSDSNV